MKMATITVPLGILVTLVFVLELVRISIKSKRSPIHWSTQRLCQTLVYTTVIFYLIVQTHYTHDGFQLFISEEETGVISSATPSMRIEKAAGQVLFYIAYAITEYACLHRFVRLYPMSKPDQFIKIVMSSLTTLKIPHIIFEIYVDAFHEGCVWKSKNTRFCTDVSRPFLLVAVFLNVCLSIVTEMILHLILVHLILQIQITPQTNQKLQKKYFRQKFYLFMIMGMILIVDLTTALIFTSDDFSISRNAMNLCVIHTLVSFSFLSNLNNAIRIANTITTCKTDGKTMAETGDRTVIDVLCSNRN